MSSRPEQFTKIDFTPKRHHGWAVVLFILGAILPPLAVVARFGPGKDFWINILLTLCGYVPGQIHNFYIQNIRDNKNHRRTPKWALRYGLVDDTAIKRRAKRKQWATRYNERLPQSTLEGQELEEGQIPSAETPRAAPGRNNSGDLWTTQDEGFYGQRSAGDSGSLNTGESSGGGRWHYPMNFDQVNGLEPSADDKKKKKKSSSSKKDRWARTEDAHANVGTDKKKKKKKSKTSIAPTENSDRFDDNRREEPEDAVGGLYGDRSRQPQTTNPDARRGDGDEEMFNHQF